MLPSRAYDGTGERRSAAEESPPAPSRKLSIGRALVRIARIRETRAARALAEAGKPLRRALAELGQAQQDLAERRRAVAALQSDTPAASPQTGTTGRDIVRAYAAQAQRCNRLASQAARVTVCERRREQAQESFDDAKLRYGKAYHRCEQLRRWLREFEASGNP
jgi:hypothetical protein